jgi:hypothetical protein
MTMTILEIGLLGPALAIVALAGVLVSYLLLRREMRVELAKLREIVETSSSTGPQTAPLIAKPEASTALPQKLRTAPAPTPAKEEITPDILAVIAAAVAHFVGAGARIRSTRLLPAPGGISPWAQQGRVIIQASHNLGMR